MTTYLSLSEVHTLRAKTYSAPSAVPGGKTHHEQIITVWDRHGRVIGEITFWLDDPAAALPVGERAPVDPPSAAEIGDADWPL